MNYFKDQNNQIFAYDDEQVYQGYGENLESITEQEALSIANPPLNKSQKEKKIRIERDRLLAETDWTQVPDAPVDAQAWADYRQALRDVPQQSGFPGDIDWPAKPE